MRQRQLLFVEIIDINHFAPRRFGITQGLRFPWLQHASFQRCIDDMFPGDRFDLAAFECDMKLFAQRLRGTQQVTRMLQGTDRVISGLRPVATCLLYTSPSPRDLSTSRMPSSA